MVCNFGETWTSNYLDLNIGFSSRSPRQGSRKVFDPACQVEAWEVQFRLLSEVNVGKHLMLILIYRIPPEALPLGCSCKIVFLWV